MKNEDLPFFTERKLKFIPYVNFKILLFKEISLKNKKNT